MKEDIFFISKNGTEFTYHNLIEDINKTTKLYRYCYNPDTYSIFLQIITSIIFGQNLILLDNDFTTIELNSLGIDKNELNIYEQINHQPITDFQNILNKINNNEDWKLTLFSSGTTGIPKRVTHTISNLTRFVRISEKHKSDIWGFAYNPTHIAGIQVFFQALFNGNTIIDLFNVSKNEIFNRIEKYQISNISATPTFYRMLMPIDKYYPSIRRITSGGERFDANLSKNLLRAFPNAKLRNIYASTEAGSVLESANDHFRITNPHICKIEHNKLYIHSSLIGLEDNSDYWYDTGDLVEIVDENTGEFVFVSRDNEVINVGGYNANPSEIEEALCNHPAVEQARVWGKPNPVIGNILIADVVCRFKCTEKELREYLRTILQDYKIPRIINFTTTIEKTRSGKIKRT